MTALNQYQRLECPGLWREAAGAQRREVIVNFGDATLILRETPSERALMHWSLPAIIRRNPGQMPALFAPGPETEEELEIDDETMIAAISKVHTLIAARRPHPGRLRGAMLLGAAGVMAMVGLVWMPGALIRHTATVLPSTTQAAIGQAILTDLQRLTGRPCGAPEGIRALDLMSERLFGQPGQIVVLQDGLQSTLGLPGNMILLSNQLLTAHDNPEVAAGFVLAERLRTESQDPLASALSFAGMRASLHLLTTGTVPEAAFHGLGDRLLTSKAVALDDIAVIERFKSAQVGTTAYARALDPSEASTAGLISGDPFAQSPPEREILNDADWVALQGICDI